MNRALSIVFDASGSMAEGKCAGRHGSRMEAAKLAFREFFEDLEEDTYLGLVTFGGFGVRRQVRLEAGTKVQVRMAVEALHPIGGAAGSPLGGAVIQALADLMKLDNEAERHIVVVTDGEASDGRAFADALRDARVSGVTVHVIAFCVNLPVASKMAASYARAKKPVQLRLALARVAERPTTGAGLRARLRSWYAQNFPAAPSPAATTASAHPRHEEHTKEQESVTRIGGTQVVSDSPGTGTGTRRVPAPKRRTSRGGNDG